MNITINSVHPGLITTNLFRHSGLGMGTYRLSIFIFQHFRYFLIKIDIFTLFSGPQGYEFLLMEKHTTGELNSLHF